MGAAGNFAIHTGTAALQRLVINEAGAVGISNTSPYVSAWGGGSRQMQIGSVVQADNIDYGVLTLSAYTSGNNTQFSIGSGNDTFYMAYDVLAGAHRLTVASNGTLTGSATNDISDQRLKENITTIPNALTKVKALKGRTFNWKAEAKQPPGIKYGFIAQEVESVVADLVYKDSGLCKIKDDGSVVHNHQTEEAAEADWAVSVQSTGIIPILVEAIKELSAKVEALETK